MDRTEKLSIEQKSAIDIFVAKIYDYALIESFLGFPRFIDSPTSYATLFWCDAGQTKAVSSQHKQTAKQCGFSFSIFSSWLTV